MEPSSKKFSSLYLPTLYGALLVGLAAGLAEIDRPLLVFLKSNHLQTTPLGNSTAGQVGFASLYLLVGVIVVFILAAVVIRKKLNPKRWVVMAGLFLVLCVIMDTVVLYWIPFPEVWALPITLWIWYVLGVKGSVPQYMMIPFISLMALSAGIGFSFFLPQITIVALLIGFIVWDMFAVLKSKVMLRLATNLPTKLRMVFMLKIGTRYLGMGDLLFYSIAESFSLSYFGFYAGIFSGIGLILGIYLTFSLLGRYKRTGLPGLPIPLTLALLGMLISQI